MTNRNEMKMISQIAAPFRVLSLFLVFFPLVSQATPYDDYLNKSYGTLSQATINSIRTSQEIFQASDWNPGFAGVSEAGIAKSKVSIERYNIEQYATSAARIGKLGASTKGTESPADNVIPWFYDFDYSGVGTSLAQAFFREGLTVVRGNGAPGSIEIQIAGSFKGNFFPAGGREPNNLRADFGVNVGSSPNSGHFGVAYASVAGDRTLAAGCSPCSVFSSKGSPLAPSFDFVLKTVIPLNTMVFIDAKLSTQTSRMSGSADFSLSAIESITIPADAELRSASGSMIFRDGAYVFAQPVPEPEAYLMMLAGLAFVRAIARRRATA